MTKVYAERRKIIWEIADLLNVKYNPNAAGMFIWAKLPEGKDDKEFIDEILYDKKYLSRQEVFSEVMVKDLFDSHFAHPSRS